MARHVRGYYQFVQISRGAVGVIGNCCVPPTATLWCESRWRWKLGDNVAGEGLQGSVGQQVEAVHHEASRVANVTVQGKLIPCAALTVALQHFLKNSNTPYVTGSNA